MAFRAQAHDGTAGQGVDIVECLNCQFAWQYPASRSADESAAVFTLAYGHENQTGADYFDPVRRTRVAQLELDYVEHLPIDGRSMLDVGGGDGTFAMQAARNGWKVTAVDPAMDPQRIAVPGLSVLRGTTGDLPDDTRFDVVTLWDVIEHVPDPSRMLEDLCARVLPGGWLVIETGNYKSVERVRSGVRHWIYQLDHRWYFSPESLTHLLATQGWKVVDHAHHVLRPDWQGREMHAGPSSRSLLKRCLRSPLQVRDHLKRHASLRAAAQWPQSGLEIFCLAAQRTP